MMKVEVEEKNVGVFFFTPQDLRRRENPPPHFHTAGVGGLSAAFF